MPNWIAISSSQHETKHYLLRKDFSFANDQHIIPILLVELPRLLPQYPLGFIYQDNTYQPVALTGLRGGQNLYVSHDGKWMASYIPAYLRSHPFRLLKADTENQLVLCIHEDNLSDPPYGKPLFDEEGNLSQPVQETLNFLNECEKNRKATQAACQVLNKAGVIEKWPLQVRLEEGRDPERMDGLYRVSEKALNDLDTETFAGLRSYGALGLAYAQLFSTNQINQLTDLAKYHAKQRPPPPEEIDWGEDDQLWIDWDQF